MISSWRNASAAFVMLASAWGLAGEPATSQPAGPVLHLLAPSHEYAANYDCLIPEAALRVAAIDLAARTGKYARFWPVDQLDQVPADAWPRVQISWEKMPPMPYAKLVRRGDLFTFLASSDGKQYVTTGQVRLQMPAKTFVGFFAYYDPRGNQVQVTVRDLRLNGRPLAEPQHRSIGKPSKPAEYDLTPGAWTITTYGTPPENDNQQRKTWRETGEFACVATEGDFELAGLFDPPEPGAEYGVPVLMCRAGLERESTVAILYLSTEGTTGLSSSPPYTFCRPHWLNEAHLLHADLLTGNGRSKRIASVPVSYVNWEVLTDCAQQFANQIRQGLANELRLPLTGHPKSVAASDEQVERLDKARQAALQVASGEVLAAARLVDSVLDEAPLCPAAHYTASLCGTVLTLGDMYGRFYEGGRFLAGPLSHWLYARELAAPQQPAEILSSAWLMLATGYPDAALAAVRNLPEPQMNSPEGKALVMFATRDYRPLPKHKVSEATRIEQLAWVIACRQCNRDSLIKEEGPWLAQNARSPAYTVLLRTGNFSSPSLGISLAYSNSVADLLGDDRISPEKRRSIAHRFAAMLKTVPSDNLREPASALAASIHKMGPMFITGSEEISDRIAVLFDLYAAALATPAGPVIPASGLRWQSLSPHDVAEQQRGTSLLALFDHAQMLKTMLGVPEECMHYCQAVAKGAASVEGAGSFFEAYGLTGTDKVGKTLGLLAKTLQTPFGKRIVTTACIVQTMAERLPVPGKGETILRPGRGAWEWAYLCVAAMRDGSGVDSDALAWRCLAADSHAYIPLEVLYWRTGDPAVVEGFLDRIPYNMTVLVQAANYVANRGPNSRYLEICRKMIELAPDSPEGYSKLAGYYSARYELAQAIDVIREAAENCEPSIQLTNLLGTGAVWLVKENRLDEALEWGRMSATSYSFAGLKGLAVALAANKQIEEAEEVWRQIAYRYDSGADEYMQFLLEHNRPDKVILDEIQALMKNHPTTRDAVAYDASRGFCLAAADPALLEKAYAGPLSFVPPVQQKMRLLTCAMYAKRFDEAVEYGLAAEDLKPLPVYERVWLHAAMRLSGRKERIREVEGKLRQAGKIDISPHIQYLLGEMDWNQLHRHSREGYTKAYAFWLRGIEREIAGDLAGAVDDYRIAASVRNNGDAVWLSYYWHKALVKKLPAATQAATADSQAGGSPADQGD